MSPTARVFTGLALYAAAGLATDYGAAKVYPGWFVMRYHDEPDDFTAGMCAAFWPACAGIVIATKVTELAQPPEHR